MTIYEWDGTTRDPELIQYIISLDKELRLYVRYDGTIESELGPWAPGSTWKQVYP